MFKAWTSGQASILALNPVCIRLLGTVLMWPLFYAYCLCFDISNCLRGHATHLPIHARVLCNEKYSFILLEGVWPWLTVWVPKAALCYIISLSTVFLAVTDVSKSSQNVYFL